MLGIVCTLFNPLGSRRIAANLHRFRQRVLEPAGRPYVIAEVLYADDPPTVSDALHLRKSGGPLWDKEAALNAAARRLPDQCDKVAWIDADLTFLRDDWVQAAEDELERTAVCQLWSHCAWLGPAADEIKHTFTSWAFADREGRGNRRLPAARHPGFAWAARRDRFPLFDRHPLGGGDHNMAACWCGEFDSWQIMQLPSPLRNDLLLWGWSQYQAAAGTIGCVDGLICHHWHGDRENRGYVERLTILQRHRFDARVHVIRLPNGLLQWRAGTDRIQKDIAAHLRARKDDG